MTRLTWIIHLDGNTRMNKIKCKNVQNEKSMLLQEGKGGEVAFSRPWWLFQRLFEKASHRKATIQITAHLKSHHEQLFLTMVGIRRPPTPRYGNLKFYRKNHKRSPVKMETKLRIKGNTALGGSLGTPHSASLSRVGKLISVVIRIWIGFWGISKLKIVALSKPRIVSYS